MRGNLMNQRIDMTHTKELLEALQGLIAASDAMPPPHGDPRNVFGQGVGPLREWRNRMDEAWGKARAVTARLGVKVLLIEQLKIVADHCNETGLTAGAGAVEEAIKIIKEATNGGRLEA